MMAEKKPARSTAALPALPPAHADPLAARAFAHAVPDLIRAAREMTRATRRAHHESQEAMVARADADGVRLSTSRISRMERMEARSEIDAIALLWTMAGGGYRWSDVYPPLAGTAGLTDDEAELLRAYRAALPHARPSITQYANLMARESVRTAERMERPANVRELPGALRPALSPEQQHMEALAREQASHEAYMAEQTALDAIAERRQAQHARKRRPRKFYGNGTNGHTS